MVGRAQDSVIQGYNNANVSSGSFGNSGIQESLAKGLGDVSTSMYGGAYAQDQQNRLQALQMAPTFANQSYIDANQLMSAGQVMQDQSQQNKDFQYEEFMRNINKPYTDLAAMSGVFGSNLGGVSKTTSEQSSGGGGK
jgi:pyridoxal/pyridoxine/pyridoxamine kinase